MQIKATIRYDCPRIRMAKIKKNCDNSNVGENAEKLDLSYIAGGMQNGRATLGNSWAVSLKGKHALAGVAQWI